MLASAVTNWLIPFLLVALSAVFAYLGSWVVKRQDVERAIAIEVDGILEQAQLLAADDNTWSQQTLRQIQRLTQTAAMRGRRLDDDDLDDRFMACGRFLLDAELAFRANQRYWTGAAVSNIRLGLDPFSRPSVLPWRRSAREGQRLFPTLDEYTKLMAHNKDEAPDVSLLAQWQADHGVR